MAQDQKLGKLSIDPAAARDFERPMKMKSENQVEHTSKLGSNASSPSDYPSGNKPTPEETQNPQL